MQDLTPSDIPRALQAPAAAATAWINATQNQNFELTGVVDVEQALAASGSTDAYELGVVLCDGEICSREQVRVQPTADGYQFSSVASAAPDIPPLLDPPVGVRAGWLDQALAKHEFVLLLFYRGLW